MLDRNNSLSEPEIIEISSTTVVRSKWQKHILLIVIVGAVVATMAWMYDSSQYLILDDARFTGNQILISSPCDCNISKVLVSEGSAIKAGDVVIAMDSEELKNSAAVAFAHMEGARASLDRLNSEIELLKISSERQSQQITANMTTSAKAFAISNEAIELATRRRTRASKLLEAQMISRSDFERVTEDFLETQRAFNTAVAEARNAKIERSRMAESGITVVAKRLELQELQAEMNALIAIAAEIESRIKRRQQSTPVDAVVDRIFAHTGDHVTEGRRLILLHDPKSLYIEVNVPETDLRFIRPGKKVNISVDAYPNLRLEGVIAVIGTATTNQFSLLPSVAPAGSFIKVTQRVPVRISYQEQAHNFRLGMQAEVRVSRSDK